MRKGAGTYRCTECGAEFYKDREPYNKDAVFCSRVCMGKYMSRLHQGSNKITGRPKRGIECNCDNCNKEIYLEPKQKDKHEYHFCGAKCQNEFFVGDKHPLYKELNDVKCKICGKEFKVKDSALKENGNCCSHECQFKSQETNILVECETCGKAFNKVPSLINKTTRHFCSKECYGISLHGEFYDPEDNRKRAEGRKWRKRVLKRDNYTCQCCSETGDELHAHHLVGYASNIDLRLDIANGVTLCKDCHLEFHKEFGKLNFTPEDYYNWLNNKNKIAV